MRSPWVLPGWLAFAGGLGTAVALILSTLVMLSTQHLAARNCTQIKSIKAEIRTAVAQSTQALGRPNSAGYHYYAAHPQELAEARRSAHSTLRTFLATGC